MTNPVGTQQNIFYYGVCEDRKDPLKLGRVRVRVVGIHSDNKADIPTEDLPWASVVISPTNAGTSGIGWSPNGLLPGSWVVVYFADGSSCQNPVVVGTLVGINPTSKGTPTVKPEVVQTTSVKAETGKELGWISELYESGGKDSLSVISSGSGDLGGKSYGPFQLSLKSGTLNKFVQMSSFRNEFAGLSLASDAFDAKWKYLAQNQKVAFKEDNRQFIESTHFVPCSKLCQFLNLGDRHQAVSEMVWSYSVQYGSAGGATKIKRALNGKSVNDLSDADILELCYNDRRDNVSGDFRKSPTLHSSLKSRFEKEKKTCLEFLGKAPSKNLKPADPLPKDPGGDLILSSIKIDTSPKSSKNLMSSGFVDPEGQYPKDGYLGKTDTNRLAKVEETEKTVHRIKKMSLVKGNGFNEPYTFDPKYPFNRVLETESGHIVELDDTSGNERIHVYHRSGSFIEFHPDGTIVKKSIKDDNEVVISNKSVYIFGNNSVFIEGNNKIQSLGDTIIESEGNMNIRTAGNMQIAASGNIDILAGGLINTASGGNTVMNAPMILQNNGAESPNVVVDIGAVIELQKVPDIVDDGPVVDDYDSENNSSNQVFASKFEMDEAAGYQTQEGPKIEEAKNMNVPVGSVETPILLDQETFKPSTKLSSNFNLGNLTTSCVFSYALQEQMGLSEKQIVQNLQNLACNVLEPIVSRFTRQAFIITCGLRHPKPGSNSKSQHLLGMAVDIQFPGQAERIAHIAQEISMLLPEYDQLILEFHSKNPVIHISFNRAKNRKMKFTTFTPDFKGKTPLGFYDKNQNLIYPT